MRIPTLFVTFFLTLAAVALAQEAAPGTPSGGPLETEQRFLDALNRAELEPFLALFSEDATVFMPVTGFPQRLTGKEEVRAAFAGFFANLKESGQGPLYMNLHPRNLAVQTLGDVAILTFHLGDLSAAGTEHPVSFSRRTLVLQKRGEQWLIVHLHGSNVSVSSPGKDQAKPQ